MCAQDPEQTHDDLAQQDVWTERMLLQPQHFNSRSRCLGRQLEVDWRRWWPRPGALRCRSRRGPFAALPPPFNLRTRGAAADDLVFSVPSDTSAADRQMPPNAHQVVVLAVAMA
jgi:hypothetical protein